MRLFLFGLLAIILLNSYGCDSVSRRMSNADSLRTMPDTFPASVSAANDDSIAFENGDFNDILKKVVAGYNDTVHIDTSFSFKQGYYQLNLKQYCSFDSSVIVPESVAKMYSMDQFITHNFITNIVIVKDRKVYLDTTITKQMFANIVSYKLDDRVLSFNRLEFHPDSICISYSLSMPLTDVGEELIYTILK